MYIHTYIHTDKLTHTHTYIMHTYIHRYNTIQGNTYLRITGLHDNIR